MTTLASLIPVTTQKQLWTIALRPRPEVVAASVVPVFHPAAQAAPRRHHVTRTGQYRVKLTDGSLMSFESRQVSRRVRRVLNGVQLPSGAEGLDVNGQKVLAYLAASRPKATVSAIVTEFFRMSR